MQGQRAASKPNALARALLLAGQHDEAPAAGGIRILISRYNSERQERGQRRVTSAPEGRVWWYEGTVSLSSTAWGWRMGHDSPR